MDRAFQYCEKTFEVLWHKTAEVNIIRIPLLLLLSVEG